MRVASLIALFAVSFSALANNVVTLASGEWYPYQSQSLRKGGYLAHIVTEAFKLEGYKVEIQYYPWARGFDKVRRGEIDGSFVYSKTKERQNYALYSDIILSVPIAIFHLKGLQLKWEKFGDLSSYRIGGALGYDYGVSDLEDKEVLDIIRIEHQLGNYKKLLVGRLDLVLDYPEVAAEFIDQLKIEKDVTQHTKLFNVLSYSLIISKESERSEELVAAFNRGLWKLKASGVYSKFREDAELGTYEK
ncbi:ABC transporter substrate-binding protein [uncultured Vibrio sp.]|uniref:substrate-binding periplasmic protein n=1 Tax=uncultured Vibrio sp. TaxID=114054 RepID=UPI0025D5AE80|nr:transporter substrate-binding domain-containing protein [uncultured Vibrio sp.]